MQKNWTDERYRATNSIHRLRIDDLFGTYSYDLRPSPSLFGPAEHVLILYGDNGTGKTTILNLLYHLFASNSTKGHKTFLARTPFRFMLVQLADGTEVQVRKSSQQLLGSYDLSLLDETKQRVSLSVKADGDGLVTLDKQKRADWRRFHEHFGRCNARVDLLSAARKMSGPDTMTGEADDDTIHYLDARGRTIIRPPRRLYRGSDEEELEDRLIEAMDGAEQWFRDQALRASNTGIENANNIYASVVRKIASPQTDHGQQVSVADIDRMIYELAGVQERHSKFSRLWLTSTLDLSDTINILQQTSGDARQIVYDVLKPYINGLQARLDALDELYSLLYTLLTNVNRMLSRKALAYDLRDGMRIISEDDTVLNPRLLSSGEKQLLLILCTIFAYRDETSTFAIDEPEISFNVKWQRDFVRVVVDCLRGSNVQLLLATHSLELVNQYRDSVLQLRS